jgi:hypothetical protein
VTVVPSAPARRRLPDLAGQQHLAIGGRAGDVLIAVSGVAVIGVFAYAITVTAGTAPRPARKPGGSRGR